MKVIKAIRCILLGVSICNLCYGQESRGDELKPPVQALPWADLPSVGISQDTISKLIRLINSTPPNDFRGLVVLKDNKLVVEEYFNTYWRETIHDIRSAGKSITAILLGIAIDRGLVKGTDQSIYDYLPRKKNLQQDRDAAPDIKIKHLLAMSSGLSADDDDPASPGNTGNWLTKENWVELALSLPILFPPGEQYVYNDICPMLIGAIVEETSGKKLADFARENLFAPLDIKELYWYTASNGRTGAMGNLYLSALDFAKVGQLVLQKGQWQGTQIVSSSWINKIFATRSDISEIDPFADSCGHFWFTAKKVVGGMTYDCLYASGNGGNLLFVVPGENLVVSLISSAYGQAYGAQRSHNIFEFVLKSLSGK